MRAKPIHLRGLKQHDKFWAATGSLPLAWHTPLPARRIWNAIRAHNTVFGAGMPRLELYYWTARLVETDDVTGVAARALESLVKLKTVLIEYHQPATRADMVRQDADLASSLDQIKRFYKQQSELYAQQFGKATRFHAALGVPWRAPAPEKTRQETSSNTNGS